MFAILFVAIVGGFGAYLVTTGSAAANCSRNVFGIGNYGECVSIIQRTVRNFGLSAGGGYFVYSSRSVAASGGFVDGDFGSNTAGQVKNFQRWMGLQVDGVIGTQTWGILCQLPFSDISRSDRKYACGY